ncbi:TIGR01777 family oxidoreductase [Corticicoccus populi]|uniref:TIGR01777 family oxidoreductase n=1 Tax=Corticicoccus populi TaxID=1812821 RepID=A0ABW5WW65_9STAP
MNILVLGGTGLIGSRLVNALAGEEYHIYVLTRGKKTSSDPFIHYVQYSPDDITDTSWHSEIPDDIEIIYNLAGATLNQKWTDSAKEDILNSRINVMKVLERFVEENSPPKVLVNASAIGYYPVSEHVEYDEADVFTPNDFLQKVVHVWENHAARFESYGIRVVRGRIGLVLSKDGGALPLMEKPYKLGVGGPIGSGRQWYSWIHIDDLVNAFLYTGADKTISGPVNFTAPAPLRQKQFSSYLSAALKRPDKFHTPKFMLNKVLGERAVLVVKGQKVMPNVLLEHHFKYLYPTLDLALENIYEK